MHPSPNHPTPKLTQLIARWREGHGLPGEFFSDEDVYRADIAAIWRRDWLFAGHTCEIPEPGDYFTLDVDSDSVIVLRGDSGEINAFHNVCRHRGSIILPDPRGTVGRLVCPYHQWTYSRRGELLSCRGMHEIDRSRLALKRVRLETAGGLIFISLAAEPPEFASARAELEPLLAPQGLERARVARSIDYEIRANWKIVWENNRECYHCNVNHPQYIKANFDHYNEDDTSERVAAQIAAASARSSALWAEKGLEVTHRSSGMTLFPLGSWYSINRTPLVDGYVTESIDGRSVATLMGSYSSPEVGTLRMRSLPNFWNHSSCDHSVSTRLLPAGAQRTLARVTWLVDAAAVEGRDYSLERLLPFWQLTSEQDWTICERAQRGVNSTAFEPGPYSRHKEYNVEGFVKWYVGRLAAADGRPRSDQSAGTEPSRSR